MTKAGKGKRRVTGIIFAILLCFVLVIEINMACVRAQRRATGEVAEYLKEEQTRVTVQTIAQGLLLDGAGNEDALIFFPGGLVDYKAYLPMLMELAGRGTDVFLVRMPGDLALYGKNRAEAIQSAYSYRHWYVGGHSLGGVCAAAFAAAHEEDVDGVVLLAAYSTKNLQNSGLRVLSVYGSGDGVMNRRNYEKAKALLPEDTREIVIEGGNHAGFGCYGEQKGDGKAAISGAEQRHETVSAILDWISRKNEG